MDTRHGHDHPGPPFPAGHARPAASPQRRRAILAGASLLAAGAWLAASAMTVGAGEAVLVTAFGSPQRVLARPGLYLVWTLPFGATRAVDTRLQTTFGTAQEVTTQDGRHLLMQPFATWRVPPEPAAVTAFLRATGQDAGAAARAIAAALDAALPATAARFNGSDLLNADPGRLRLAAFAAALRGAALPPAQAAFGVTLLQAGLARLTLPEATLAATEARMRAERVAEAAQRTAQAQLQAAEIRAEAERDSRIALADARTEAAGIEAASRKEAADIQAKAYNADPELYLMLRSLDTLSAMVGPSTRLVLRTDAAPFNMLVQGPPTETAK